MKKALFEGILGSFFFAFTFILNRSMDLSGGYWMWSGVLRYVFTLPLVYLLLFKGQGYIAVLADIRKNPARWIIWSTVGFGLFYAPLTWASTFSESWFTASVWQFTIVAGILLTPLFGKKIPVKNLLISGMILAGIFVMQIPEISKSNQKNIVVPLLLIMIAAFSYPLGNRKMMSFCNSQITTIQRVFGMTLCSMPFWIICGLGAAAKAGMPTQGQLIQTFLVALFSGVIATVLFFDATNRVKDNPKQLAVIEATQSGEVVFTLLLGILFAHETVPSVASLIGIIMIVAGMILNSLIS